ncbi:hypothetical protein PFLUV_G00036560 [Perca fluviatilis]|uniref:Uncharacterized protein n=2 Tax=Perca fluviatilis TaxID=8168 RepID=A0A6A5FJ35_PERFL|nr:uncharacterized protein LOC120555596 isoform X1 [Perca fluviatilis]KAF1393248.1 hypothetical protein PFLUV_G00036560 [Perca fluviatilis]
MAEAATVLRSKGAVENFVKTLEETTRTKYIVHKSDKHFHGTAWQPSNPMRVRWEWSHESAQKTASIPFDGVPFVFIAYQHLGCHLGRDRSRQQKMRYAVAKQKEFNQKNRRLIKTTKKLGCPAVLNISRIAKFPDYKVADNKDSQRRKMVTKLKEDVKNDPSSVRWEDFFYVRTPAIEDHVGHPLCGQDAGIHEPVDERVKSHIIELTKSGVRRVSEMRQHSRQFVERHLFKDERPPSPTRRRFYPTDKDIRNLMGKAKESVRHSSIDQENLQPFRPLASAAASQPPAEAPAASSQSPAEAPPATKALRRECIGHLKAIMDYVNLIKDDTYLKELRNTIKDLHGQVALQAPVEAGPLLLPEATKKRKAIPSNAVPLPKQPKEHAYANRGDEKAEMIKN